jgi:hypothetical protein
MKERYKPMERVTTYKLTKEEIEKLETAKKAEKAVSDLRDLAQEICDDCVNGNCNATGCPLYNVCNGAVEETDLSDLIACFEQFQKA